MSPVTKGTSTVTRRGIHIGSIFIFIGGMVLLTFALLGSWTQAQGGGVLYVAIYICIYVSMNIYIYIYIYIYIICSFDAQRQ